MRWLHNFLFPTEHQSTWFIYTIIGSLLPIIVRFLAATTGRTEWFDYTEVLFAGIAMNLSNFALAGNGDCAQREYIIGWSMIFTILLSASIMIFLLSDGSSNNWIAYSFSFIIVLLSVYINFVANRLLFKKTEL
jgi:hypothetical protein